MIELVRKAPFLRIFTLTVIGVLISKYVKVPTDGAFAFALTLGLICFIGYFFIDNIRRDLLWGFLFNSTLVVIGLYLGLNSLPLKDIPKVSINNPFWASIEKIELTNDNKACFIATLLDNEKQKFSPVTLKAKIEIVGSVDLIPGDVIRCEKGLRPIQNRGEIGEFDYKKFSAYKGIYYNARIDSSEVYKVFHIEPSIVAKFGVKIKGWILSLLDHFSFAADEKSVLLALTTGDKSLLENNTRSSFSTAGLMHVLAVSGLHVGIIYLVLLYVLKPLQGFRGGLFVRNSMAIFLLFAYAVFTGMTASVLRATLMFSFLIIGQMFNRNYSSVNSLFASAFILVLFNPNIIYDVGFQLSYIAVLGILLFYKPINAWINSENIIITKLWSLCALSLAAQIATTPISLYYFHQFPTYFLLGNLLIVPIVGLVIQGALLFFALSFWEPIANILALGVRFLIKIMVSYASWVETLPASVIANVFFDLVVLIILYLILLYAYSFFTYPYFKRLFVFSVLILIALGYISYRSYTISQIDTICSTKDKNPTLIFISNKRFSTLSIDSVENFDLLTRKVSSHYGYPFDHVGHTQIKTNEAIIHFNDSVYWFCPNIFVERFKSLGIKISQGVSKVFCRNGAVIDLSLKNDK